jgi:hypothetical protein
MSFINDQPNDEEWEIEIQSSIIADALSKDPSFIAAISLLVRDQMTKDARIMGNLYGQWAQSTAPTANNTTNRLT